MDSEQMLVNWLLETLQNGSSWLLFNHIVLTKTTTQNLATHECGSINEIRSIRHFHFCINQKLKYIKYSLENQFSIFFWCGSMHCVWVTRTLVWALESVLGRKPLFSCWIRSRVKHMSWTSQNIFTSLWSWKVFLIPLGPQVAIRRKKRQNMLKIHRNFFSSRLKKFSMCPISMMWVFKRSVLIHTL